LRQEFRELELLDEITRLKYEGILPHQVDGATRVALIHSYRTFKGMKYIPRTVHGALKWSEIDTFEVEEPYKEAEWEILKHSRVKKAGNKINEDGEADANTEPTNLSPHVLLEAKYVPAKGSIQLSTLSMDPGKRAKRKHTGDATEDSKREIEPMCFNWNEATYSCAFDTLFSILNYVYQSHNIFWVSHVQQQN
ncbi:hypothetical protein FOMPIDRAFT_1091957, partial [Fomitopsis schrenkii]